jgi:chromosome segregation ATPase
VRLARTEEDIAALQKLLDVVAKRSSANGAALGHAFDSLVPRVEALESRATDADSKMLDYMRMLDEKLKYLDVSANRCILRVAESEKSLESALKEIRAELMARQIEVCRKMIQSNRRQNRSRMTRAHVPRQVDRRLLACEQGVEGKIDRKTEWSWAVGAVEALQAEGEALRDKDQDLGHGLAELRDLIGDLMEGRKAAGSAFKCAAARPPPVFRALP